MAEIGLVASAIGVIGFIGQLTQGCVYLKTLLDQVKDGPTELCTLWRELELVASSAEDLVGLWSRLKESGNATVDPTAALQNCNQAVSVLTEYIKPFLLVLSNPDTRITSAQRSRHRLKGALQRSSMKKKLENLIRAKQLLLEVQMNMSLAILDVETRTTRDMSFSLSKLATSSNTSDDILKKVHEHTRKTATEISKTHEILNFTNAEISTSNQTLQRVLEDTERIGSNISETHTRLIALENASNISSGKLNNAVANTGSAIVGIRRTEAGLGSLIEHITETARTATDKFEDLQERLLSQVKTEFAEQAQSQELVFSGLSSMVDESVKAALQDHCNKLFGHNMSENTSFVDAGKGHPLRPQSFKIAGKLESKCELPRVTFTTDARCLKSRIPVIWLTYYWTPFYQIVIKTISYQKTSHQKPVDTSMRTFFELRLRITWLRKLLVFTGRRTKYSFGLDTSMRIRNIVRHDAPIMRALKDMNIELVQKLFQGREASPFDVDSHGNSLLVIAFQSNVLVRSSDKQGFIAIERMITFLIQCGSEWDGCVLYAVPELAKITEPEIQDSLVGMMRKIIAHSSVCPFHTSPYIIPASFLDLTVFRSPLGQILLQQEYWEADWDNCMTIYPDSRILLWENDRNILADLGGNRLKNLLNQAKPFRYAVLRSNGVYLASSEVLRELLIMAAEADSDELRVGCLDRVVLLLNHGWNPRQLYTDKDESGIYSRQRSISEYAASSKALRLWTETLELVGWSAIEIMHLLDEDIYIGFQGLVDGATEYLTHDECWADFISGLVDGRYVPITDYCDITDLATSVSCNLRLTDIYLLHNSIAASNAAFSLQNMPGSWPETRVTVLQPGENHRFDLQIAKLLYQYKEDWLERYGYAEFVCQPDFLDSLRMSF